jgi:dihydrofolate reductase
MLASVFIGISVDGFIARPDGSFDFLSHGGEVEHGYEAFFASVDALVIGRGTFETVLAFDTWPYGEKRVVVLSSRPLDLSTAKGRGAHRVEQMAGNPREIVAKLDAQGVQHAYVDGGVTIQRFLRAGLIQRLVISRVPILIGSGRPLFGALNADVKLRHVATRSYSTGLVQSEYEVEI